MELIRNDSELDDRLVAPAVMGVLRVQPQIAREPGGPNDLAIMGAISLLQKIQAVQTLLEALRTNQLAFVRMEAARALGELHAKDSVPGLIEATKDDNPKVRLSAVGALGEIGPPAASAVPVLVQILKDRKEVNLTTAENYFMAEAAQQLPSAAATALGRIGAEAKVAVPVLIEMLNDKRDALGTGGWRGSAAEALGGIGPASEPAIPILIELMCERDGDAATALAKIGPAAAPALVKLLSDRDDHVRRLASEALAEMGPKAKSVAQELTRLLKESDEINRFWIAQALKKIDPEEAAKAGVK